jgi:tetratricopeptide (TPR) repeat protein
VPELSFNAGNALHRLESYERAVAETQRALPPTSTRLGAATFYALGNHLLALDRLEQAYDAYRNALLLDPSDGDAKFNLELTLLRMLAQEQPPQPQPGESQPGEQPGEQQPGEGQQPQPPQPGQQPTTPPSGPQQDPTRSLQEALEGIDEELTFEEAIRILDALREQQQRPRQDQGPGGGTWPDY